MIEDDLHKIAVEHGTLKGEMYALVSEIDQFVTDLRISKEALAISNSIRGNMKADAKVVRLAEFLAVEKEIKMTQSRIEYVLAEIAQREKTVRAQRKTLAELEARYRDLKMELARSGLVLEFRAE